MGGFGKDIATDDSLREVADEYRGGPGADYLYDPDGRNTIEGGPGDDLIAGQSRLLGGPGDDRIRGESNTFVAGPRVVKGGTGEDYVYSRQQTDDTFYVADGERDTVSDCGDGTDTVYFDEGLDEVDLRGGTCENLVPGKEEGKRKGPRVRTPFASVVCRPVTAMRNVGCDYVRRVLTLSARVHEGVAHFMSKLFADPPFNLGKDYGNEVSDSLKDSDYLRWCERWIAECVGAQAGWRVLPLESFPLEHQARPSLNGAGMMFRHWVAVDIKYSLPIPGRLYPSHYSLLYYTKGKPKFFERPRVPNPVCRHCGGDIKDYGGHRNKLHPDGLNLTDVWTDIPPVRHRKTKRRGANELSIKLLRRVLEIASEPGNLVLDPFGGGSTYAAAEEITAIGLALSWETASP